MNSYPRILLLDKAEPFRRSTAESLREVGYRCEEVDDVSHGRALLAAEKFDLLVTDMGLNGGTGIELIRYVMKAVPGLPVIVVTDSPSLDYAMQAVELPVVAYLPKSTPFSTVHAKIQAALANSVGRRAAARIQRLLRRCADDLEVGFLGEPRLSGGNGCGSARVPISTLQTLAGCLGELVALETDVSPDGQVGRLCELLQCPVWRVQRNAIHKCILLLHETKRRFKSKELAQVRETLEQLLKTLP